MNRALVLALAAAAIALPGAASADMYFGADMVQPKVQSNLTRTDVRTDVLGASAERRNVLVERYPFPLQPATSQRDRREVRDETRPLVRSGALPHGEADAEMPGQQ